MDAQTLRCPSCGSPSRSDSPKCDHCSTRLATVSCPNCFGLLFLGSIFCQHCGKQSHRSEGEKVRDLYCPKCEQLLAEVQLGESPLHDCTSCRGLWVRKSVFDEICRDRERQAAIVDLFIRQNGATKPAFEKVRYIPCPDCGQLMHRINFAKYSGIVIDVCKHHGSWLDETELFRAVQFIRDGGLDKAREKEMEELRRERERIANLKQENRASDATYYDHRNSSGDFYSFLGEIGAFIRWLD